MRRGRLFATELAVLAVLLMASAVILVKAPHIQLPSAAVNTALGQSPSPAGRIVSPSALPRSTPAPVTSVGTPASAGTAAPVAAVSPAGALLSIPRIGIRNAPIYDRGTDLSGVMLIAPGYAVTHYASSARFGSGNAVLYGHDDIQGNIFGRLYDLSAGDMVLLSVGGETQAYRVTGHQIVPPTAIGVLNPTGDVRLTIITCWPFNVDTKRWIVTAIRA